MVAPMRYFELSDSPDRSSPSSSYILLHQHLTSKRSTQPMDLLDFAVAAAVDAVNVADTAADGAADGVAVVTIQA